jgi:polyisoprenoid-binding protein YceI
MHFPSFFRSAALGLAGLAALAFTQAPPAKTLTYALDPAKSKVVWEATKVTGAHNGTVQLAQGSLVVENGKLSGGSVEVDMRTIVCKDLAGTPGHDRLVGHLKSEDFFSAEKFPIAKFGITQVKHKGGNEYEVSGDMSIKGITKPLSFPATVSINGLYISGSAKLKINRTDFDIRYRSGSYFENLGDKLIYDEFTLDLALGGQQKSKS